MGWTPDSRIQKLAELQLKRRLDDLATKANEARADAKEHHGFSRHAIAIMHSGVDAEIAEADSRLARFRSASRFGGNATSGEY